MIFGSDVIPIKMKVQGPKVQKDLREGRVEVIFVMDLCNRLVGECDGN